MSELLNSIWLNGVKKDAEGYSVYYPLDTNKIDIPDGSKWPKGTKLKFPFVYDENGQLTGFCDTKSMIANSGTNIYLPYEEIEADFSSINKGTLGIHAPNATVKKAIWQDSEEEDIPEAQFKYKGCKTVDNVKTVDNNYKTTDIVDGTWSEPLWDLEDNNPTNSWNNGMFYNCSALTTFTSDLSSLTNGWGMFRGCVNLTSFESDLRNLVCGNDMFSYSGIQSFDYDVPRLESANHMFSNCGNITSFRGDTSNVKDSYGMFAGCISLTSFYGDLSSIQNGCMFSDCKLDTTSIKNIAETIHDINGLYYYVSGIGGAEYSKSFVIGIGNIQPTEEEKAYFTQIHNKGWEVYINGQSNSNIFNPQNSISNDIEIQSYLPYWAKPISSNEECANYIDSEGNYYNILGAQFIYVSDPETYGMFTCEEDAASQMRLTPYTKPQTEIEN